MPDAQQSRSTLHANRMGTSDLLELFDQRREMLRTTFVKHKRAGTFAAFRRELERKPGWVEASPTAQYLLGLSYLWQLHIDRVAGNPCLEARQRFLSSAARHLSVSRASWSRDFLKLKIEDLHDRDATLVESSLQLAEAWAGWLAGGESVARDLVHERIHTILRAQGEGRLSGDAELLHCPLYYLCVFAEAERSEGGVRDALDVMRDVPVQVDDALVLQVHAGGDFPYISSLPIWFEFLADLDEAASWELADRESGEGPAAADVVSCDSQPCDPPAAEPPSEIEGECEVGVGL